MNIGRYLRGEDSHVGATRVKQPNAEAIWKNKTKQRQPVHERDIERRLVKRVKELGGEVRKVVWPGRRGAPDRLVMLGIDRATKRLAQALMDEHSPALADELLVELLGLVLVWPELKAPGVKPESHQLREHERMRAMGQRVVVIDSIEGVEELLS